MRGELDDALARMARMEELQRRLAAEPTPHTHPPDEPTHETRPATGPPYDGWSPVDDVVESVRRVVEQHPQLAVTMWAEDGVTGAAVRVEWVDGVVTVTPDDEPATLPSAGAPPPSWPARTPSAWVGPSEGGADESAARLAALIRRDPSLLRAPDDTP